jgi:lysozyme family protein
VRRWEGGYTVDHAGPTNYGITKPFYQEYLKDNGKSSLFSKSVRSLTEKDAIGIYHDQIWKRGGVEDVATASDRAGIARSALTHKNSTALLGVALGNGSVNYGEGRAERFLKEAFDGAGIPAGELADRAVIAARQGKVDKVLARYLESEEAHYKRLGKEAKYDQYLEGWMNRHNSLEAALRGPLREGVPVALLQKDVK